MVTKIEKSDLARDALYEKVNQIASEIDDGALHKKENETITSLKTFQNQIDIDRTNNANNSLRFRNNHIDKAVNPPVDNLSSRIYATDKNLQQLSNIYTNMLTNGSVVGGMNVQTYSTVDPNGDPDDPDNQLENIVASIELAAYRDGHKTLYTNVTPDANSNTNAIPTTAWVNSRITAIMNSKAIVESGSNYVKFGNGLLIEFNVSGPSVGNVERTITFPKPFTVMPFLACFSGGGGSGGYRYNSFTLTKRSKTSFSCIAECVESIDLEWIAVGY